MIFKLNDIDYEVINIINKKRRSIGLKILSHNKLGIYSPYVLKEDDIYNLLLRHKRFILNRTINNEIKDDVIHILGNEYKINIIESDINDLLLDEYLKEVRIYTKNNNDKYVFSLINDYYKNILTSIVNKYFDNIKKDMNINFDIDIIYKRVNSYFGECYYKKRLIILNTKLSKYELKYILSVIYHELAHFYYQNHQAKFYKLLDNVFPDYKNIQKELRKIKYNEKY